MFNQTPKRLFLNVLISLVWYCAAIISSQAHEPPVITKLQAYDNSSLQQALSQANKYGYTKIIVEDGTYNIKDTINITAPFISLVSKSGEPNKVIMVGQGMQPSKHITNLLRIAAAHFTLDGITLQESGNHLIQIAGESNADYPIIKNCVLRDAYEQILKVSYNRNTGIASDYGLVENCRFEYTKGIGPQYYIGGIDVHGGQDWVVKNNLFIGIASPENKIAEHAIHFWNNTQNIQVLNNTIINCDRGIGFGMPNRPNFGGVIKNNLILHADNNHPNADTGIALEESQGTQVLNNRIFLQQDYANAIEYRFKQTINVLIKNNRVNKRIRSRNSGAAKLESNYKVSNITEILSEDELKKWQHYLK